MFGEILSQGSMFGVGNKLGEGGWGMRIVATIRGQHLVWWTFPSFWEIPTAREKQTQTEGTQVSLTSWLRLTRILFLFKNCKFEWNTCNILFQRNHLLKYHMVFGFHLRLVLGCVNVAPGFPPARCAGQTQAGKEKNSWNQAANPALQKHTEHWHQNW